MTASEESLSSSAWWKQVSKPTSAPITLKDVIDVVVPHVRGQALLAAVPSAPFTFNELPAFHVDLAKSTVALEADGVNHTLKLSLSPHSPINFPDVYGLGSRSLGTVICTVSSRDTSFSIEFTACTEPLVRVSSTFTSRYPLEEYFAAVKYTGGYEKLPIIQLLASIMGDANALAFFSDLPIAFCSAIDLPSYLIDVPNTSIDFSSTPFGVQVAKADIHLQTKAVKLTLGEVEFSVHSAIIHVTQISQNPFDSTFDVSLSITLEVKFQSTQILLQGTLSRSGQGPYGIDFRVTTKSNLQALCSALGVASFDELSPPLGGDSLKTQEISGTIGCSFIQTSQGAASSFRRSQIFFEIQLSKLKPLETFLPVSIHPAKSSDVTATLFLEGKSLTPGLKLRYLLSFETYAGMILEAAVLPLKAPADTYAVTLSMNIISDHQLPPPTIGALLTKLTSRWADVANAIPIVNFKGLGDGLVIVSASVEVSLGVVKPYKPQISGWAVRAVVPHWAILSKPSIEIENAELDISWSGYDWQCSISSLIKFGSSGLTCDAEFKLPTKDSTGFFRLRSFSNTFKLGNFVQEIGDSIKLTDIPVLGSSPTLANTELSLVNLHISTNEKTELKVTGFEVQITWPSQIIGQLSLSNSELLLIWYSTENDASGRWAIQWEGFITPQWFLTAQVQLITSKDKPSRPGLSGEILDMTRQRRVSSVVDKLIAGDDPSPPPAWDASMPPTQTIKSSFTLDRLYISADLGSTSTYVVAADARWGKDGLGSAVLVVEKAADAAAQWDFTFAVGVKNLLLTDIFADAELAKDIGSQLTIKNAFILAFRYATPITLAAVERKLQDLGAWKAITSAHESEGSLTDSDKKAATEDKLSAGFALAADLDFLSAPEGTCLNNLVVISNTSKCPTTLKVACCIQKKDQGWTDVIFAGQLHNLELTSAIVLEDVVLSYMRRAKPSKPNYPILYDQNLELAAKCQFHVTSASSWDLVVKTLITDNQATLSAYLAGSETTKKLAELGSLEFGKIQLSITYQFASVTPTLVQNEVSHRNRKASWNASLVADLKVGGFDARLEALFVQSLTPQVLVVKPRSGNATSSIISLSALMRDILGSSLPEDLLDISLSDWKLYYAAKQTPRPAPEAPYEQGFFAEAKALVYGVSFIISASIYTANSQENGMSVKTTKSDPIDFCGILFHGGLGKETSGPSFAIFAQRSGKGCLLSGGITLFGSSTSLQGGLIAKYDVSTNRFQGDLGVKADFIPGKGEVSIKFQIAKGDDQKMHFRFLDLPADFDDVIKELRFIKAIQELSKKDKCGMLTLAFKNGIRTKVSTQLSLSEKQLERQQGKPLQVSLDVKGTFTLEIIGLLRLDPVAFNIASLIIVLPEKLSLEEFGKSVATSLIESAESVVQGLYENKGELMKIMAVVALKEFAIDLIAAYLCRGRGIPPDDAPEPDQKVDPRDGPDEGPSGVNGWAIVAFLLFLGVAIGGGLLVSLLVSPELIAGAVTLGVLGPIIFEATPSSPPKVPEKPDLSKLDPNDPFKSSIDLPYPKLGESKDFISALQMAAKSGRGYRDAITFLQKLLGDSNIISKLGRNQLATYRAQLKYLVGSFSALQYEFSQKWLVVDPKAITIELSPKEKKMRISWKPPHDDKNLATAMTLRAGDNNKQIVEPKFYSNSTAEIPWDNFDANQKISVQVAAFVIMKVDRDNTSSEDFNFFASGSPAECRVFTILPSILPSAKQGTIFNDFASAFSVQYVQLNASFPIAKIDVYTRPLDGSPDLEALSGLSVLYRTPSGTNGAGIAYGNTTVTVKKSIVLDSAVVIGVTGRIFSVSGKPDQGLTQISFLVLDKKTGQSRLEGPFGSIPKGATWRKFGFSGKIVAPFGRDVNDTQNNAYGLRDPAFLKNAFLLPQLKVSSPIEKIEVYAQPIDGYAQLQGLFGLKVFYQTPSSTIAVSYGNTKLTVIRTILLNESATLIGVGGRICPVPGMPGDQWSTYVSFLVLDLKTGQSKLEGPFGGTPNGTIWKNFSFSGKVAASFGRDLGDGDQDSAGKLQNLFSTYLKTEMNDGLRDSAFFKRAFQPDLSPDANGWPVALRDVQFDRSWPIERVDIYTLPFDASGVPGITGLSVTYRTQSQSGSRTVSHGTTEPAPNKSIDINRIAFEKSSFIIGVTGKICSVPGKPNEKAITQISLLILKSNGECSIQGPFGSTPKNSTFETFSNSGKLLALYGREIRNDYNNPYGLRGLGFIEI